MMIYYAMIWRLETNERSADRAFSPNMTNDTAYYPLSLCICQTHDTADDTRLSWYSKNFDFPPQCFPL